MAEDLKSMSELEDLMSEDGGAAILDFWSPTCGPCKAMAPAFEEAASVLEPGIRVAKLNTEDEQMIGSRYGIRSIPTMVLFHKGEEIARQSGAMMAGDIIRWVQSQAAVA